MKKNLNITDAELEVMNIIWEMEPLTSSEVVDLLSSKMNWKPNTILTLISRLVKKEILTYEKQGRVYSYSSTVSKEDYVDGVGKSFMERFFDGSLMPMLAHFTSSSKLTLEEKEQLKKLLDDKE